MSGSETTPVTLVLLRLSNNMTIQSLLKTLLSLQPPIRPLIAAEVDRWIVAPHSPALTAVSWDALLVLPARSQTPSDLFEYYWTLDIAVPTPMLLAAQEKESLRSRLKPDPDTVPPVSKRLLRQDPLKEQDDLEVQITKDLLQWLRKSEEDGMTGPVSMLNLMSYPSPAGREQFMAYIPEFTSNPALGPKSGSTATLIGSVTGDGKNEGDKWEDSALVWYPNLHHFVEMVDSEEYRAADRKFKVGSLRDSGLMCVREVEIPEC